MKNRIREDILNLRRRAKIYNDHPCEAGCPFDGDCEICSYLFPVLFDNYMEKSFSGRIFRVEMDGHPWEAFCPCSILGRDFVSWRINLFMHTGE